jgi:hypothetical protein
MMDCASAKGFGTYGCSGGLIQPAFGWAVQNKGVVAAKDHTYYGQEMFCTCVVACGWWRGARGMLLAWDTGLTRGLHAAGGITHA